MRSKSPSESKSTALRNPHEVTWFTISNSIGKRSNPSFIMSRIVPDEHIIKSRKPSLFQSAASKLSKALSVLLFNKLICIEKVVLWFARICLNHKISISCLGSDARSHFFNQAMLKCLSKNYSKHPDITIHIHIIIYVYIYIYAKWSHHNKSV